MTKTWIWLELSDGSWGKGYYDGVNLKLPFIAKISRKDESQIIRELSFGVRWGKTPDGVKWKRVEK